MAPKEQVKYDLFESRVDEGMLEWYRRRYSIPKEFILHTIEKKFRVHEPFLDWNKMVVYVDQLKGGLRFPLDPFVRDFLNRFNIALG